MIAKLDFNFVLWIVAMRAMIFYESTSYNRGLNNIIECLYFFGCNNLLPHPSFGCNYLMPPNVALLQ
jgi:hypothetical protein